MPLSLDTLFVQPSNSGTFSGTPGTATLPIGTTAGSTVLLCIASSATSISATGFTDDSGSQSGNAKVFLLRKANVGAGETSWSITSVINTITRWTVYELAGLDPVAPLDVKLASTTATTSGTTPSSGTLARSTTYDGLVVALHANYNSASTAPTTFSGHTNGMTEMDEGSHNDGVGKAVNLSVSMKTVQQLDTYSTTAIASATLSATNSAAGTIAVYSATDAKREANIGHFWGFFPGVSSTPAGLGTGTAGSRYFETVVGSPAITADGLQLTGAASAQNVAAAAVLITGQTVKAHVERIRFRLDSLSGDLELATLNDSAPAVVRYVSASQKIGVKVGTGTEVLSNATVTTGQWYNLDLRHIGTTTARTVDWQLDYGAGPIAQTQATFTAAGTLGSLLPILGWATAATGTVTYAYAVYSIIAGHYPLGDFTFVLLGPDLTATPTVSGTVGNFAFITNNATGAALTSGTLANVPATIDDFPPTVGASADGFCAITASPTDYLRVPLATYNASGTGSIRAVRVVIPMWAASATAWTCRVLGYDGTTQATLFAEANPTTDNSSTPGWVCKMWRPSGGWTQAKLDAAAIDFGAADATPDGGPLAEGIEVAIQNATAVPVIGEPGSVQAIANQDPVTGGILAVTVDTPAGEAATLNWEAMGTPGSQTVAPASSHTQVFDAADVTGVTFLEVVSDNEDPDRP